MLIHSYHREHILSAFAAKVKCWFVPIYWHVDIPLRELQDYSLTKWIYNDPVFQGGANSRAEQFRVEGVSFGERMSPVSFSSHEIQKHKHIQTEKTVIAGQAVTVFLSISAKGEII